MNNANSDYTTYATKTYEERCIELKNSMDPDNHPPLNDRLQNTSGRLQPVGMQFLKRCYYYGLDLIPLKGFSKRPEAMGWQKKPRMTAEETKATFKDGRCNVGIRTGRLSGVIVVDADNPQSVEWCETMLPTTQFTTITGKRTDATPHGGKHYYYRHPARTVKSCDIKIDEAEDIKVEIKSDGKQVVAPYSIHPDSQVEYRCKGDWADIDALPIFDMRWFPKTTTDNVPVISLPPAALESPVSNPTDQVAESPKSLKETSTGAWYKDMGHTVEEGQRNKTLFTAACDYQATGQPLNKAILDLLPEAIDGGLPQYEALQTIRSAYGNPRTATKKKTIHTDETITSGYSKGYISDVIDTAKISGTLEPEAEGIWGNIIQAGRSCLIMGHAKSGKSTFVFTLLQKFFDGTSEFIYPINPAKVMLCSEEHATNFKAYGNSFDWGDENVFYKPRNKFLSVDLLRDPDSFAQLMHNLGKECKNNNIKLVIFDTFVGIFKLDSFNDSGQINKAMNPVNMILCDQYGLAVVYVHHMKKTTKDAVGLSGMSSGSETIAASVDVLLSLHRKKDNNKRVLRVEGRLVATNEFDLDFDILDEEYTYTPLFVGEEYKETNHKIWSFMGCVWQKGTDLVKEARVHNISKSTVYRALETGINEGFVEVRRGEVTGKSRNTKEWKRTEKQFSTLIDTINANANDNYEAEF